MQSTLIKHHIEKLTFYEDDGCRQSILCEHPVIYFFNPGRDKHKPSNTYHKTQHMSSQICLTQISSQHLKFIRLYSYIVFIQSHYSFHKISVKTKLSKLKEIVKKTTAQVPRNNFMLLQVKVFINAQQILLTPF